jgi:hypothetical protein
MSLAEWNPFTTYVANDIVAYTGATYISLQTPNLNQNPSTATTFWAVQGGSGVVKITAGANTSISPSGGVGNVTITSALSKQVSSSFENLLSAPNVLRLFSTYVAPYTGFYMVNFTITLSASNSTNITWTTGSDLISIIAYEGLPGGTQVVKNDFLVFVALAAPPNPLDANTLVATSSNCMQMTGTNSYAFTYSVAGTPTWDDTTSQIQVDIVPLGPAV